MKKFSILFLIVLGILAWPLISLAALVPCGGPGQPPCQLCHLFVLLDNIIDFLLAYFILPLAVLLLIIAGIMFFLYPENPERISQAKSLLIAVIIGLVLIFAAFLIIGTFLRLIGLADWTENIYRNWWQEGFFEIDCPPT